jgi:drug/metabolite transporter (DMT)-like permease
MIWLFLSILSSVGIFVSFGYFSRLKVNNQLAISVNYSLASIVGFILAPEGIPTQIPIWWLAALFLGSAFIYLFYKMAILTQEGGLALSTMGSQMSMVIPIGLAPILYHESLSFLQVLAVIIGLSSIALMVWKKAPASSKPVQNLLPLTLLIFIGTGLCTSVVKYSRHFMVSDSGELTFISTVFAISALLGWIGYFRKPALPSKEFRKGVLAGLALGIPNLGSLVFLIKSLATPGLDSSFVFPINNIGIVLVSTLLGSILFKERLHRNGKLGILCAVLSVLLLVFLAFGQ